jgi:hypothetical protein
VGRGNWVQKNKGMRGGGAHRNLLTINLDLPYNFHFSY